MLMRGMVMSDYIQVLDILSALMVFFSLVKCKKHIIAWLFYGIGNSIICFLAYLARLPGLCVLSAILCIVGIGLFCTKPRTQETEKGE